MWPDPASQTFGTGIGCEDQGPIAQSMVVHVDVTSSRNDNEPRLIGPAQPPAQVAKLCGCGGIDGLRSPRVARRRPQRAGADQHRISTGTKQSHDKAIARVAAADRRSRFGVFRSQSDDAINRGNEVGDEGSWG